ncbi:MAG: sulfatase-like hydrolase/transferase [Deltaproteobacteria bacterium]|nr:sulfatase-like hydrolase/transferase [Deltaproteobacteria bacterium]
MILLEILLVAIVALLVGRLAPQPWRGRFFNLLKLYLTVRMVWLLLEWPMKTEGGEVVPAWNLVLDVLRQIEARTFWTFAAIGAAIRFSGVVASMYRWLLVLRGQGIEFPFRHIFGAFLIGRAIGFFLPSTAGLDAYKLYDASRLSGKTVEVTAGTVLEKVLGITGIFLTFLVSLPFGYKIFGESSMAVVAITVPMSVGIISGLLTVLWYPGLVSWVLERLPIPGKARLEGVVLRISSATSAYRNKKLLVLGMLFMSFLVHFTTASMYYFMAIAVGAGTDAVFWPIVFGSAIQIFATVIGPTIGGLGVREAAQLLTVGAIIGPGAAIVSATLGFWVGEVPTLFGFLFWMLRGDDYRPEYCRVNGVQVDYEEAAKAAVSLESEEAKAQREAAHDHEELEPLGARIVHSAQLGLATGVVSGILIGLAEALIIRSGGFGAEAQVLWFGPLAWAVVLGGLGTLGGIFLGVLPMGREEARGWTPSLGIIGTLVPFGLFVTVFRLFRDVYQEQMPPVPILLGAVAIWAVVALVFFFAGRRIFATPIGKLFHAIPALGLLALTTGVGFVWAGAEAPEVSAPAAPPAASAALADKPNVILVMVDTLRADHLSCYGHPTVKTPNLCSLADDGTAYQGFSHASWTKPATASLLTSTVPSTHGAMSKPSSLGEDIDLVSEVMQRAGYSTGGIVANINLAQSFGFEQGYDEYHYLGPDYIAGAEESSSKLILYQLARQVWFRVKPGLRFGDFYQDSEVVNGVAFDWLDRHAASRFFLFLHYMDPHDPYFEHPYDGNGIARVSNPHPEPGLGEEMQRLYLEEIEYLDGNFGKLLAKLHELGLYENTVIALVADHGEEFHEHEGWWHGLTLYEEQIHVPMLVKWPAGQRGAPARVDTPIARLIDVAPTLAALAGADVPKGMQGIDLRTRGSDLPERDAVHFAEEDHEGNVLTAIRTEKWHLIRANEGNPRELPEAEIFDMRSDRAQASNQYDEVAPLVIDALDASIEGWKLFAEGVAVEGGGDADISREECEKLRVLGYVESCE